MPAYLNFFLSYDLNGKVPSHADMDKHLRALKNASVGRVLETVWYVHGPFTKEALYEYVNGILSANDRLLVIDAKDATFRNLLVTNQAMQQTWIAQPVARPVALRPPVSPIPAALRRYPR